MDGEEIGALVEDVKANARSVVVVIVLPLTQLLVEQEDVVGDAVLVEQLVELLIIDPVRALDPRLPPTRGPHIPVPRQDVYGDAVWADLLLRAEGESRPRLRRPNVGVTQVGERIWLVTFMHDDLGYFDDETCRLEPIENPFAPKLLPMSPE